MSAQVTIVIITNTNIIIIITYHLFLWKPDHSSSGRRLFACSNRQCSPTLAAARNQGSASIWSEEIIFSFGEYEYDEKDSDARSDSL